MHTMIQLPAVRKNTLAAAALALLFCSPALASHSTYNPMAPRQISVTASTADYSYGYSILPGNSIDTLEPFNRYVGWAVNYYAFDRYLLRPIAHGYAKLPDFMQTGVGNFFGNLSDGNSIVTNLLVGDPKASGTSLGRFGLNTTIGILGLFDVAGAMGIAPARMGSSTVMGRAGVDQGAYLMIPFTGPTTERELHGDAADNWYYCLIDPFFVKAALTALKGIHARAQVIDQESLVDDSIDPYAQIRQIYLMYSEGKVDPDAAMRTDTEENAVDESFLEEIDAE